MTKTLKMKWLKVLKSGKYIKTMGSLYRDGGYCCLGVLGKCIGLSTSELKEQCRYEDPGYRGSYLEKDILYRIGLSVSQMVRLADLNDKSDTFNSVIKVIEKEL